MNINLFRIACYRFSYSYHIWVWRIGWVLLAALEFCGLVYLGEMLVSDPMPALLWSGLLLAVILLGLRWLSRRKGVKASQFINRLATFLDTPGGRRLWWILLAGAIACCAVALGSMGAWDSLTAWLQTQPFQNTSSGWATRSFRFADRLSLSRFWGSLGLLKTLAMIWLGLLGLWWVISSWHSIWFRYLALWFCLALGRLQRWLLTGWRGAVVVLAATTLLAWIYSQLLGARRALVEFLTPGLIQQVLVILGVLVVLYWAANARRRLAILNFADYTGEVALKASVDSISVRLLNELVSLARLYQSVASFSPLSAAESSRDEATEDKARSKTAGDRYTSLYAADVGQTLQGIIATDSRIKVGLVDIPIGLLVATLGRIVEGPRLSGSLQRVGNQLALLAGIGGGGLQGNWRVSQSDLDQDDLPILGDTHLIDRLVHQLAFRIFTDLEQRRVGTVRWRAVRCFTEGLRAYRDAAQSKQDRIVNLSHAEKAFVRALSFDEKFAQCHYNLGITLLDLDKAEAAQAAFLKARQADPTFLDADYALAEQHWRARGQAEWWTALRYCNHILQMQADEARAWRLKGMTLRLLNWELRSGSRHLAKERARAIETSSIAVMLAWQRLCRSALGDGVSQGQKARTARYVLTLGLLTGDAHGSDEAALYRQALHLTPADANLHANLGWALEEKNGDWAGAARAFERAAQISNDRRYWIEVIIAYRQRLRLTRWLELSPSATAAVSWGWQKVQELATDLDTDSFEQVMPQLGAPPPDQAIDVRRARAVRRVLKIKQGVWKLWPHRENKLQLRQSTDNGVLLKIGDARLHTEWSESESLSKQQDELLNQVTADAAALAEIHNRRERVAQSVAQLVTEREDDLLNQVAQDTAKLVTIHTRREQVEQSIAGLLSQWEAELEKSRAAGMADLDEIRARREKAERSQAELLSQWEDELAERVAADTAMLAKIQAKQEQVKQGVGEGLRKQEDDLLNQVVVDAAALAEIRNRRVQVEQSEAELVSGQEDNLLNKLVAGAAALAEIHTQRQKTEPSTVELLSQWEIELKKRVAADKAALDEIPVKRQELIQQIEQRQGFYERHGRYWSASQVALQLAKMTTGTAEAVRHLQQAIELLERGRFVQDTRELKLHSRLVQMGVYSDWLDAPAYRAEREIVLNAAEQAAALEPDDAGVRQQLGRICMLSNRLERAEAELTSSLLLAPNNPTTVEWLANTHWTRAMSAATAETRRDALCRAVAALNRVLELVEGQSPPSRSYEERSRAGARGWAHWWLGRFHRELLDYDSALAHLRVAGALGYAYAETRLEMGLIYLHRRVYDQAEACFQDLIEHDDWTTSRWPRVGSKYEWSETYRTVAQLYLALAWAERSVNLRRASLRIDAARQILGDGAFISDRNRKDNDECWALHDVCHGWVQFRKAQLGPVTDPAHKTVLLDRAIADLELAVSRVASADIYADAYLRLARVCDERAKLDLADKGMWLARAKEAAQHCQVADLRREYTAEIDKLLAPPTQPQAKPDVLVEVGRRR